MNKIPVLSESPSKAEIIAWYAAAEKFVNEVMIKAKAREAAKKKKKTRKAG